SSDLIVSILEKEPVELLRYLPKVSTELQRIVRKALRKDREERYQTARALVLDLSALRRKLEIESELQNSNRGSSRFASFESNEEITHEFASTITEGRKILPTIKTERLIALISNNKKSSTVLLAAFIIGALFIAYWSHSRIGKSRFNTEPNESNASG